MADTSSGVTPLIIPSSDFGYPIYSVFDERFWLGGDILFDIDEETGLPVSRIDALYVLKEFSLSNEAQRDGHAILRPNQPYSSPRSRERWLELLNVHIADLQKIRDYFEQETPDQISAK